MKRSLFTVKLAALLLLTLPATLSAQLNRANMRDGEDVEYCKTHVHLNEKLQDPAFKQQFLQGRQAILDTEAQMKANPNQTRNIYYIPVVFHILHNGGTENISDEQIFNQMEILNRDFRLLNADANNVQFEFNASNPNGVARPADTQIEFRLATKAPNGTCFNGITRTFNALTNDGSSGGNQVNAIVNGNDVFRGQWPGNKYLNIFVVNDAGGAAGYTTQPNNWSSTNMNNGIWILHHYVGNIGTGTEGRSRAVTHEVGHWLDLDHTWGGSNTPGVASNCNIDDGIADTPNTVGVQSCKLNENTCGPKANVENYMDYSYCSKMFTVGQSDRMRAALASSVGQRNNVVSSANLVAVGADGNATICKAAFDVSAQIICKNNSVTFTDRSFNNVQTRSWEFQGGTPSTSTSATPVITYNTPGVYQVKLTVGDGANSLTETKTAFIKVLDNAISLPYFEGFENATTVADLTNYAVVNSNSTSAGFEVTTNAAKTGTKSLYLNNFTQTVGNVDEFISPNIDLSDITTGNGGVTMSFRYALTKKSSSQSSEVFKIFISNSCGDNYVLRRTLTGTSLANEVSSSSWTPTAADWKTVHVTNITSSYFVENFRYRFSFESNGGNNLFIDDINIYAGDQSEENVLSATTISPKAISNAIVYPNPTTSELTVSYNALASETNTIQVVDVVGKIVMSYDIQANEGLNEVLIDTESLRNGMYFVKIANKNASKTLQFIKE